MPLLFKGREGIEDDLLDSLMTTSLLDIFNRKVLQKYFDTIAHSIDTYKFAVSLSVRDFPSAIPSDSHSAWPLLVSGGEMDDTISNIS